MKKERTKKSTIISLIIASVVVLFAVVGIIYNVILIFPENNTDSKEHFKDVALSGTVNNGTESENSSDFEGTNTKEPEKTSSSDKNKEKDKDKAQVNSNESNTAVEKVTKVYSFDGKFKEPECKIEVFYDAENGNRLPYRLMLPVNYNPSKKYPVVVFLHSAGETGADTAEVPAALAMKMYEYNADLVSQAFILCPQSYEWWQIDKEPGDEAGTLGSVLHLLDELKQTYSCDSNRIYVTGISMGGYGTWDLLANYGDVFAADMPMCGGGSTYAAAQLAKVPIRIYHSEDDNTVSVNASRNMYNAIKNAGGNKVIYCELSGLGHAISDYVFCNREALSWMFAQNKATNPTGEYEYIPYFKVVDSKGKTVISDSDVDYIAYSDREIGNKYALVLDMYLKSSGKDKLTKAYTGSSNKSFTVYWLNQKLFTYTASKAPKEALFTITDIFDEDSAYNFSKTVQKSSEELSQ